MMENIDDFTSEIGLTPEQSVKVKAFIKNLLIESLKGMKEEYNGEIDNAIGELDSIDVPEK